MYMTNLAPAEPLRASADPVGETLGRLYLGTAWWISAFPGVVIVVTVLAYNVLGEGLRDQLDPRRRR